MTMKRSYSELIRLISFEERFKYLKLTGDVGKETFGWERMFNQQFYRSKEWQRARDIVIVRDNACDLGMKDHEIFGKIFVHHINPITLSDIQEGSRLIFEPENLITVSFETHNAIHYGDTSYLKRFEEIERKPNDMAPWKG